MRTEIVLSILLWLTSVIHRRVYKEVDELQQVGSLLGASVETKEKISLLIARAAFEQHDYETAHEVLFPSFPVTVTLPRSNVSIIDTQVCQKLMSLGNTTVSAICADLARAQDYRDVRARLSLVRAKLLASSMLTFARTLTRPLARRLRSR